MIAIQIELSVGRCGSCKKFRNNMEWKVDEKIVCLDCFKTFKNQRLIDKILTPPKEIKAKTSSKAKTKAIKEPSIRDSYRTKMAANREYLSSKDAVIGFIKASEKPVAVNEMHAAKVASKITLWKWINNLFKNGDIVFTTIKRKKYYIDFERKYLLDNFLGEAKIVVKKKVVKTLLANKILKVIKESPVPLTPFEINQGNDWAEKSIYPALATLVRSGKIVACPVSLVNQIYIDVKRRHLLEKDINYLEKNNLLGKKTRDALDFILSRNKITSNKDIAEYLGVDRSTSIRIVQSLKEKKLIHTSNFGGVKKRSTVVAPLSNQELCRQIDEIEFNSTDKQIKRLMDTGETYTISECCLAIGSSGSDGTRQFIKNLLIKWGCKTVKKGNGIGYYLEKVEG